MPVATIAQYRTLLDAAAADGWALPAINVTSSLTAVAALAGLAAARSDGILQMTTGGAAYAAGDRPGQAARGAAALAAFVHEVAGAYDVRVALHTDHCVPELADAFLGDLLERTARRRAEGLEPLFQSHMLDGSALPLEENLTLSAAWLARCAALGVILEVECGVVGGEEDGVGPGSLADPRRYTTDADLLAVAEALGTGQRGRYLLAATFGNVHGLHAADAVELRPAVLADGQLALGRAHPGARFQYVFHGSSGTPPEPLAQAIAAGVVKVNVDTELQHAFTSGVVAHVHERAATIELREGPDAKRAFDPRVWGRRGQQAMAERVADECRVLGSAGRTQA